MRWHLTLSLPDVAFDGADGVEVDWMNVLDRRVARVLVAIVCGLMMTQNGRAEQDGKYDT